MCRCSKVELLFFILFYSRGVGSEVSGECIWFIIFFLKVECTAWELSVRRKSGVCCGGENQVKVMFRVVVLCCEGEVQVFVVFYYSIQSRSWTASEWRVYNLFIFFLLEVECTAGERRVYFVFYIFIIVECTMTDESWVCDVIKWGAVVV